MIKLPPQSDFIYDWLVHFWRMDNMGIMRRHLNFVKFGIAITILFI